MTEAPQVLMLTSGVRTGHLDTPTVAVMVDALDHVTHPDLAGIVGEEYRRALWTLATTLIGACGGAHLAAMRGRTGRATAAIPCTTPHPSETW